MIFDGKWQVSIATPIGRQFVIFDIKTQDGVISGTATQKDETVPLEEIVPDGNRLTWSQNVTKPLKLRLKFDVLFEGDKLSGMAKAGILPTSTVSGERIFE
jgi:hypothetical protein